MSGNTTVFGTRRPEYTRSYFFIKLLMKFGMKNPYAKVKPALSPELLAEKALQLRSVKSQFQYYYQKIKYMSDELAELWENDIQTSFIDEIDGALPALRDFAELADEYAALLDLAAQELRSKSVDIDKSSVFGGEGPVSITLTDIPYLNRSRIDLKAYDPYFQETQDGVATDVRDSRKNDEYMYRVYDDHIELVKYIGLKRAIEIPREIDGLPVTHVGQDCFAMAWRVKPVSIDIPEGVTTIYPGAFRGCQFIRELRLPRSLVYIGNYAFGFLTGLERLEIPDNVVSLGSGAFRNCSSLLSVTVPSGTKRIGNDCFYRCKDLKTVTIGSSVVEIDGWAFRMCEHLSDVRIGENVVNIGASAFYDCVCLERVDVPDKVESIGDAAFYSRRGITLGCSPDSTADRYARANKLRVVHI